MDFTWEAISIIQAYHTIAKGESLAWILTITIKTMPRQTHLRCDVVVIIKVAWLQKEWRLSGWWFKYPLMANWIAHAGHIEENLIANEQFNSKRTSIDLLKLLSILLQHFYKHNK